MWKQLRHKRSDVQQTTVTCKKSKKTVTRRTEVVRAYFTTSNQKHPLEYEEEPKVLQGGLSSCKNYTKIAKKIITAEMK